MRKSTTMKRWLLALSLGLATLLGAAHAQDTVTYVYTDAQGTPLAETDETGHITASYDYTPYGSAAPNMSAAPNGPGYTGHVNDPDTGLVYMQARYYDPSTGRFLSVDPVGPTAVNVSGFNRYVYANNNPIVSSDPDGRESPCVDMPNGCSDASPATKAAGHAIEQYGIGLGKAILNHLPTDAGEPDLTPSNGVQAVGMVTGDVVAGAVVTAGTDGDGAEVGTDKVLADLSTGDKTYYRLGGRDSLSRLTRKASEAEHKVGHGVSVSTTKPPAGEKYRSATDSSLLSRGFQVKQTGRDSSHHTVMLPKPMTKEAAKDFNDAFGG